MDDDRFDSIAKRLIAPTTRRSALGATVAGGLLSALGFAKAVPETRAAQGGTCVVAFAAQVLQGPSAAQPLTSGGGRGGEVRGDLSFALSPSGSLDNAALTLADGTSLPVVGQVTGYSLQVRIELAPRAALVAVGVGERPIAECRGAIDGVVAGPQAGDLGDWHAAPVQQARAGGGGQGGSGNQGSGDRAAQGDTDRSGNRANRGGRSGEGSAPSGASGGGSSGGGSGGQNTGGGSSESASGANAPSCPPGETFCDDAQECRNLSTSPLDCGACGNRCPDGPYCLEGRCVTEEEFEQGTGADSACDEGLILCDGVCVDLQTDPLHCGQCGLPCASELGAGTCIDGVCACSPGTTRCDDVCVNTERDPLNCGECGTTCGDDEECFGGTCAPGDTACPPGQTDCGGVCVDLSTDPDNCGTCGNLCPVSPEIFNCEGGVCVPPSCDPLTNCGGLCVDLQTDSLHCGGCGLPCAAGEECRGSLCVPIGGGGGCKTGLTPCGPTCADLQTDPAHCGACGASCPSGEACVGGACAPCPEGQILCGDACRNGLTLPDGGVICSGGGAPPASCPAGQSLCNGVCYAEGACPAAADCPPGWGYCYGICKDFATDPGYCGNCETACPGAICSGGVCTDCAAGLTPCGTACVDTRTDLANCGFCGNACGTLCIDGQCTVVGPAPVNCGNAGESCADRPCCSGNSCVLGTCYVVAGTGEYRCGIEQGLTDCGGVCIDTRIDRNFCGGCQGSYIRCGEGSECRGGMCTVPSASSAGQSLAPTDVEPQPEPEPADVEPCPDGQVDCGGVCTDLALDPLNCGGCFNACAAGDACQDGQCRTPVVEDTTTLVEDEPPASSCPEGQVDCGGYCADLLFDAYNCGGCDVICESGSVCDIGVCAVDPAVIAPEDGDPAATAPDDVAATCGATGDACDPASPGTCCSGVCNDDGACA